MTLYSGCCASSRANISVSVAPGETALTVTFFEPISMARALVNCSTAALPWSAGVRAGSGLEWS
jgi:hypothetical protein